MKQLLNVRTSRAALVALCMVVLQLVTALHFALVPHGFSAGLSGFVHVHETSERAPEPLREHPALPSAVSDGASCVGESCPIGFAGHYSVLLGNSEASALLALVLPPTRSPACRYVPARNRVLSSAPKTSPPV